MFFSQEILQRRGKFGIIWLASTQAVKLKRREISSVDIKCTCENIIDYILRKIPRKAEGLSRPRFSLYLSAKLMFGVTYVYGRQADFVLGDVRALCHHYKYSLRHCMEDIDLKIQRQPQIKFRPPNMNQITTINPFFGEITTDEMEILRKSPNDLLQKPLALGQGDELVERKEEQSLIQIEPEKITLKEVLFEDFPMIAAEDFLPLASEELHMEDLEDIFSSPEPMTAITPRHPEKTPSPKRKEDEQILQTPGAPEKSKSPKLLSVTPVKAKDGRKTSEQTPEARKRASKVSLDERFCRELLEEVLDRIMATVELKEVERLPESRIEERTQNLPEETESSSWELSEFEIEKRRKQRQRFLKVDKQIQISKDVIRKNIVTSEKFCKQPPKSEIETTRFRPIAEDELFHSPGRSFLSDQLKLMFRKRKILPTEKEHGHLPIPETSDYGTISPASTESVSDEFLPYGDEEIELPEALREPASIEISKRIDEASLELVTKLVEISKAPEEVQQRMSLEKPVDTLPMTSVLEELSMIEEEEEFRLSPLRESPHTSPELSPTHEEILQILCEKQEELKMEVIEDEKEGKEPIEIHGRLTFRYLYPPMKCTSRQATRGFTKLLEMCAKQQVSLSQERKNFEDDIFIDIL